MNSPSDIKIANDSVANGAAVETRAKVPTRETWGVVHGEYTPTADEQAIIDFFNVGIDATGKSMDTCLRTGRLRQATQMDDRIQVLMEARDLIACGHHRTDHPVREIDPVAEARNKLGRTVR